MNHSKGLLAGLLFMLMNGLLAQTSPRIVYEGNNGCLEYRSDSDHNHIVDFSYAGYKYGEEDPPNVPVVRTIAPVSGDNTTHIQSVIDEVGAMPLNGNGLRGAVLLRAGTYQINGSLRINKNGVVLRGEGKESGDANNTILRAVGNSPSQRDLIILGNTSADSWDEFVSGSGHKVTNEFVSVGTRALQVESVNAFEVGEQVLVHHPSTSKWLSTINFGDTDSDSDWDEGDADLYYLRYIDQIDMEEGKVILDVPVYDHLELELAQTRIYKVNNYNVVRNSGVENLRIFIETDGDEDEDHAWSGVALLGVEDCWVEDVNALHFGRSAVYTEVANRVTVRNCGGFEPHSEIDGSRRYNFAVCEYSNNILFDECRTSHGRHSFISNGRSSVSGVVWHDCISEQDITASEGHKYWTQALLFDNITFNDPEDDPLLGLYNRGSWGSSHGWGAVNSVAWNIIISDQSQRLILQKPPGRQNYAIGSRANVTNDYVYDHPIGHEELTGQEASPFSLYEMQLEQRLTDGPRPDAPVRMQALHDNGSVHLNWLDIAADEDSYIIEYSKDGGQSFQTAAQIGKDTEVYTHSHPVIGGTMTYRVAAVRNNCKSPFSNEIELETITGTYEELPPSTTGNPGNPIGLEIFPNPADTYLNLNSIDPLKKVTAYNALGRQIASYDFVSQIDVSDWTPGFYLLKIETEPGDHYSFKLMVK